MKILHRSRILVCVFSLWLLASSGLRAADSTASEPVGAHRLALVSGPNFISVPLHGTPIHQGTVQSVSAAGLTLAVNPGWTPNQFGPRDGFPQYLVLVRTDASASPGIEGDWWTVVANTVNSLTVATRGENLTSVLGAGDLVEVRRLTSFKSVFGSGPTLRLIADANFDVLTSEEDVIRFVDGSSFGGEVFYHDGTLGPAGFYLNGNLVGSGDGSTLTLLPDQPIVFFRKTGAAALELLLAGSVLETRFSHYLAPGPNAVGVVYPVPSLLETSNLKESGWISDLNFDVLTAEEDIIRAVQGTSFGAEIFHYAGLDDLPGWYVNGVLDPNYQFEPTTGFIFFIKGPDTLRWRESVGFGP